MSIRAKLQKIRENRAARNRIRAIVLDPEVQKEAKDFAAELVKIVGDKKFTREEWAPLAEAWQELHLAVMNAKEHEVDSAEEDAPTPKEPTK